MVRTDNYRRNPQRVGTMRLSAQTNAVLTDAGTYYKLATNIVDGASVNFTLDEAGKLTYTGPSGKKFLFSGVANITPDKGCTVRFALYISGERRTDITTPVTFQNANTFQCIGANDIITLNNGQYLEIYATSDVAETTLTIDYLSVVVRGE